MMRHICPFSIILQYSCPFLLQYRCCFLFAVQMPFSIPSTDVLFYFQYRCPFPFPVLKAFSICSTDIFFYLQYRCPFPFAVQISFSICSTDVLFISSTDVLSYLHHRCPFLFAIQMRRYYSDQLLVSYRKVTSLPLFRCLLLRLHVCWGVCSGGKRGWGGGGIRGGRGEKLNIIMMKCCFTSIETVGLLGTGAQDGHLDFHTAP